ncbi:Hypothetical Protein RradSPS_3118 (plasmid) [Rubrobacter radiotolerans]|uniref:Uncharacterized protein n=1 Tax=Rubrobacter radiotolerans TaxID=42256 RepID=A0A023X860_RUBRA|nr:Hypothetical Protein RradSPS_3118 [Rubrobacter radiotolerans]
MQRASPDTRVHKSIHGRLLRQAHPNETSQPPASPQAKVPGGLDPSPARERALPGACCLTGPPLTKAPWFHDKPLLQGQLGALHPRVRPSQ